MIFSITTTKTTTTTDSTQKQTQKIQMNHGCGVMVTNAEIKASFNKETTMGLPLTIFGKPIPDFWIPVVSGGLVYPFGNRHRVLSIQTNPKEDRIDICGAIYFNGDAPPLRKNIFGMVRNKGPPLLPPPPRRFPALPGSS